MGNIIKPGDKRKVEPYKVDEFSSADRGESAYSMQRFSPNEITVQEQSRLNTMKVVKPPTKRAPKLFGVYDDDDDTFNEQPKAPRLFGAYESDDDLEITQESPVTKFEPQDFSITDGEESLVVNDFNETTFTPTVNPEVIAELEESKELIQQLEAQIAALQADVTAQKSQNSALSQQVNDLNASLPAKLEESRQNGYNAAVKDLENRDIKQYEAEKQDYLSMLESKLGEVDQEIAKVNDTLKAVDEQMPEIIISYVKQLIGEERVLNDKLITNIVSGALDKLKDLQNIIFSVNPEDAQVLAEKYPQYGVNIDPAMPKGSLRMKTKVGEMDLSIDSWVDSLEKQIHEQFKNTENN